MAVGSFQSPKSYFIKRKFPQSGTFTKFAFFLKLPDTILQGKLSVNLKAEPHSCTFVDEFCVQQNITASQSNQSSLRIAEIHQALLVSS